MRYEDISPYMRNAIIAIEDQRFYENSGVDVRGIGRALVQDVLSRQTVQGASTIAQQFVKNALRAQYNRTVFEKLREAALAYHLTRKWPKSKILTQYLNSIYFGNGAYGVESAARTYFGNQPDHQDCGTRTHLCVKELKPEEAALIAGIVANPTAYDPVAHPQAARARRNLVLKDMFDQGLLPRAEYLSARVEALPAPVDIKPPTVRTKAPYFTTWVRQQLVDQFGARKAFEGGLKIKTTLDLELQDAAEKAVNTDLPNANGPSAAVVAIDNQTGAVRAMVGGRDYATRPFNLATQGQRQPGSAIKPFILAARAEEGLRAGLAVAVAQARLHRARHQGAREVRRQQLREQVRGLADARRGPRPTPTTPSSRRSASRWARRRSRAWRERMGIRTPVSTNYAMTLGGLHQGVTPLDMAHAYETFIEHGRRIGGTLGAGDDGPVGIDEVLAPNDKVLKQNQSNGHADPRAQHRRPDRRDHDHGHLAGDRAPRGARPGRVRGRQDRHDREQRRRLVRRLQRALDRGRVGRLPRQAQADAHRVRRRAGRGRHLPGAHLARLHGPGQRDRATTRNAKDRERKGLPPKPPEDTQTTTTPAPVIPTKPAPVPEGGASAPPAPQTPDGTEDRHRRRRRDRHGHGHGDPAAGPDHHASRPPRARTGGTGASGGASAPP